MFLSRTCFMAIAFVTLWIKGCGITGRKCIYDPREMVVLIHQCLCNSDERDLVPYLFTNKDLDLIAIDESVRLESTISRNNDDFDLYVQNRFKASFYDSLARISFANSHIISYHYSREEEMSVFLEMIKVKPTKVIRDIEIKVEAKGLIVTISAGELMNINGHWKIFGGIKITNIE